MLNIEEKKKEEWKKITVFLNKGRISLKHNSWGKKLYWKKFPNIHRNPSIKNVKENLLV